MHETDNNWLHSVIAECDEENVLSHNINLELYIFYTFLF